MPHEAPDDREAGILDDDLDRVRDVGHVVADPGLRDAGGERLLADVEEGARGGRDLADRERHCAVGDEPVKGDAEVDRDQVAFAGPVLVRDAVYDHRVRRDAQRRRKALVALRGRGAAALGDVLVCDPVELEHRDARLELLGDELERLLDELARPGHPLDLLRGLADDHASALACTCSSAFEISDQTSSIGRSACTFTSFPVVR